MTSNTPIGEPMIWRTTTDTTIWDPGLNDWYYEYVEKKTAPAVVSIPAVWPVKDTGRKTMTIYDVYVIDALEHEVIHVDSNIIAEDEKAAVAIADLGPEVNKKKLASGQVVVKAIQKASYEEYVKPVKIVD